MKLYDLFTCHRVNPVIDTLPEFSWKIQSDEKDTLQLAYRIVVKCGNDTLWDSGKVQSDKQSFVEYAGQTLSSEKDYLWSVTVWDNHANADTQSASFRTAFLDSSLWQARWIECPFTREPANEYKFGSSYPPVLFTRRFAVNKPVKQAFLYASACGVYRPDINGARPDNRELAPEFTPYGKEFYYQVYDVSGLLKKGENELNIYVGDGWYFSAQAGPVLADKRPEPGCIFQMRIDYADGSIEKIFSGGSEVCRTGYIVYSDLYQGEKQDFTLPVPAAVPVKVCDYSRDVLACQPMEPVVPVKLIPAVDITRSPKGEAIVDFGEMVAGRARIALDVPKGTKVTFEYFEVTDMDGNYINTMFAPQKDTVISNGEPLIHEALFTFHGFRYIRVTGPENIRKEDFTAVLLSTGKENLGSFSCSDERLNKLYQNIRRSQYCNMMSIPTDCPSREKAGWTGDILVYASTAMLNENMTPFLTSWLRSVRLDQSDNGTVMIVSPYMQLYDSMLRAVCKSYGDDGITGVAGWSDAIVRVPYDMYLITGNELILRENYAAMKKWVSYIERTAASRRGDNTLPEEIDRYLWNTGFHFGEWLIPGRPHDDPKRPYYRCPETAYFIAPFFGYMTVSTMAQISKILGYTEDCAVFETLAGKMKNAIIEGLIRHDKLPRELMGGYILAFAFDLVSDELKEEYRSRLVNLIHRNNDRLDTGFLATPYILSVLTDLGERELARKLLWQNQMPSWLYEVEHDATSIWEAWDADGGRKDGRFISYNHYAFGCVDSYLCRNIAGIDSRTPGFKHLIIHPDTDCGLKWCRREYITEAGPVRVFWDSEKLEVEIPCNRTATVYWKNNKYETGSGRYIFN